MNHDKKFIIFGAWDKHTDDTKSLIFGESWKIKENGNKRPAYGQSREHIRLIEEEGYALKTFPLVYSDEKKNSDGTGPSKIGAFTPALTPCALRRSGGDWYAEKNSADRFSVDKST